MENLVTGSVLVAPKGLGFVVHKVVVASRNTIFHNAPGRGEHVSSLSEFRRNNPTTRVVYVPTSPLEIQAILNRIEMRLAKPRAYDPLNYNCDHAASIVLGWPCESPQLQTWLKIAAGAALVTMLARA